MDYEYLGEVPHGKYICNSLEYQASKFVTKVLEECLKEKQEREPLLSELVKMVDELSTVLNIRRGIVDKNKPSDYVDDLLSKADELLDKAKEATK